MKYCALLTIAAVVAVVLVGCGGGGGPKIYDSQTTQSGLQVRDTVVGTGPTPNEDDIVVVNYTGWLTNGHVFDTSEGRDPFEFALGTGAVIKGWDEGLKTMRVGGQRRLIIPPELAYGVQGNESIPPNATLIFDVELVQIKPLTWVTTESGLKYADIKVGDGASPYNGSGVAVEYTGWLMDGTKFFSTKDPGRETFRFTYGKNPPDVIPGWEEGMATMKVGGTRKIIVPPDLAFGIDGEPPQIPPNATLKFEIELTDVQ